MKICGFNRYGCMETALKEAGLKVDKVAKQGKKTVITVIRYVKNGEKLVSPQKAKGK